MPEVALRNAAATAAGLDALGTAAARDVVPVLPALRTVVPGGGLRPGSVMGLDGPGAASLGLALVAGVSRHGGTEGTGGWCGVVGMPDFGVAAAAAMGAAPERLLLVDEPGGRWADVVAALVEAVDLVLIRPPERPGAAAVRRLSALVRRHGCVLTLTGTFARDWAGVRLRLRIEEVAWEGLGGGHGRLRGRRARVVAEGRDAPGPGRRDWLWLPGPDGDVSPGPGGEERPAPSPVRRPLLEVVADGTGVAHGAAPRNAGGELEVAVDDAAGRARGGASGKGDGGGSDVATVVARGAFEADDAGAGEGSAGGGEGVA